MEIWVKESNKIKGGNLNGLMIIFCHELRGVDYLSFLQLSSKQYTKKFLSSMRREMITPTREI